eukprot:TRINITY_DN2086_c0_g1_i1.p1 TRINITY_DN2086_c0_g1~~TRINITY_DN2086_c0_g1_i1.p1  ORF type:complete len:355 (+),score=38.41 TRINITY_DN2086_c0_g1_i1:543-1607(+)
MYGFPVPAQYFKKYMEFLSEFVPNLSRQYDKFSEFFGPNNKLKDGITKADIPIEIVRSGVPPKYRGELWKLFCGVHEKIKMNPGYFEMLVEKKKDQSSEHTRQIDKDVHRTFPYFRDVEFDQKLRHVLVSYSWHNPEIGYCQSMNIIAGVLLVFMDEESAFWTLDHIVGEKLPNYYSSEMIGAITDSEIFEDLLKHYIPKLCQHLMDSDIKLGIFVVPQFLTLFGCKLPKETAFRIWDCILFEGSKVLLEVLMEFIYPHAEELLKKIDDAEVVTYLNVQLQHIFNPEDLIHKSMLDIDQKSLEIARSRYVKIVRQQSRNSNNNMNLLDAHMQTQCTYSKFRGLRYGQCINSFYF